MAVGFLFVLTCDQTNAQSSCRPIYVYNLQLRSLEENTQTSNFLRFAERLNREYTDANGKNFICSSVLIFSTEDIARSITTQ